MHLLASNSCDTLVDLNHVNNKLSGLKLTHAESFSSLYDSYDGLEETSLYLPNGTDKLYLPRNGNSSCSLDEYLSSIPCVAKRSEDIVFQHLRKSMIRRDSIEELDEYCDEESSSNENSFYIGESLQNKSYLTVMQGELAHATPSQFDVIASTDATTCHIIALRSTCAHSGTEPLVSLTHVDKVGYENCLQNIVTCHLQHHKVDTETATDVLYENYLDEAINEDNGLSYLPQHDSMASLALSDLSLDELDDHKIDMELHLVGGFLDNEGSSQELSNHLITLFHELSAKYQDTVRMTIGTALISCMNNGECLSTLDRDSYVAAPIGRGMGICARTGKIFLLEELKERGPVPELRAARLFSSSSTNTLSVIHTPEESSFCIQPFEYQSVPCTDSLLNLPDEVLLQYTSTSPECESSNFCNSLRETLQFMNQHSAQDIFGLKCNRALYFERNKNHQWVPSHCNTNHYHNS